MEIKPKTREEVNQETIQRLVHESRRQQNLKPKISDGDFLLRIVSISGIQPSAAAKRAHKSRPAQPRLDRAAG
jgi:hypothetical protein